VNGFKPSKDRYKHRERRQSGLQTSWFQTLKGSLQTHGTRRRRHYKDVFQTLKGSLQTVSCSSHSSLTSSSFKPSKDRYKHSRFPYQPGEIYPVSNPQRIATNRESMTLPVPPEGCFKPSKDRYKLDCVVVGNIYLVSFKPSKDRYKPVWLHRCAISWPCFKPSKDRYKLPD